MKLPKHPTGYCLSFVPLNPSFRTSRIKRNNCASLVLKVIPGLTFRHRRASHLSMISRILQCYAHCAPTLLTLSPIQFFPCDVRMSLAYSSCSFPNASLKSPSQTISYRTISQRSNWKLGNKLWAGYCPQHLAW